MAAVGTEFARENVSPIVWNKVYGVGDMASSAEVTLPQQSLTQEVENGDSNQATKSAMQRLADSLNEQFAELQTNIRFHFNDAIGDLYISVSEKDTGRIIRTIPSEEAMKLEASMREFIGVLFDKKV